MLERLAADAAPRRRPGAPSARNARLAFGSSGLASKTPGVLGDQDGGGLVRARGGELEAADRGGDEPPGGVGLARQPVGVARQGDLVEVGEAVVGEREVAEVDPPLLGLDPLPGRERDREVGPLA